MISFDLCIDYALYPIKHPFPTSFEIAGVLFTGSGVSPPTIRSVNGEKVLFFGREISIVLAFQTTTAKLRLITQALPYTVEAFDLHGSIVYQQEETQVGKLVDSTIFAPAFRKLIVQSPSGELGIARMCANVACESGKG